MCNANKFVLTLALALLLVSPVTIAQAVAKSWRTTPQGDYGYFQDADADGDALFLVPGNQNVVINRWRSPYGNQYRLWTDTEQLVVGLRSRTEFDSALTNFGNREDQGRHWCEIVSHPWDDWVSDPVPTDCGIHAVTEARTCTTGGKAAKPCADSCPEASQTRQVEHDNGACNTLPSIHFTGLNGGIDGEDGTNFSPTFGTYDPDTEQRIETYWQASGGCYGLNYVRRWITSVSPVFRRHLKGGATCTLTVRVRDGVGESPQKSASGSVVKTCDETYLAPDGRTPEEYAQGCRLPASFMTTNQCGDEKEWWCHDVECDSSSTLVRTETFKWRAGAMDLGIAGSRPNNARWVQQTWEWRVDACGAPSLRDKAGGVVHGYWCAAAWIMGGVTLYATTQNNWPACGR